MVFVPGIVEERKVRGGNGHVVDEEYGGRGEELNDVFFPLSDGKVLWSVEGSASIGEILLLLFEKLAGLVESMELC